MRRCFSTSSANTTRSQPTSMVITIAKRRPWLLTWNPRHASTPLRPSPQQPPPPPLWQSLPSPARSISTTSSRQNKNQIFDPIRNSSSFHTHLSLSSSLSTPLLTLWTASWCPTCRTVEPLLRDLISSGVGEQHGGVLFAPVEFDAPEMLSSDVPGPELAMTYAITSVPTLLSFDAGEAQVTTRVTDGRKLADRQFLVDWIVNEAKRRGGRGGGGGGSLSFGGLFGSSRS